MMGVATLPAPSGLYTYGANFFGKQKQATYNLLATAFATSSEVMTASKTNREEKLP